MRQTSLACASGWCEPAPAQAVQSLSPQERRYDAQSRCSKLRPPREPVENRRSCSRRCRPGRKPICSCLMTRQGGTDDHATASLISKSRFRDFAREVSFPIWNDSPWSRRLPHPVAAGDVLQAAGESIAKRISARSSTSARSGPVCEADAADGFSPLLCQPQTRFDREAMFAELVRIAEERIDDVPLRNLTCSLLLANRDALADAAGRHAQSSCLRRRLAGARAERHPDGGLSGRQIRRLLSRHAAAAQSRPGRGRSDPARHRQVARDRRTAARGRIYRGGQPDRPHPARARHRPRGGRGAIRSIPKCCCGSSTSSFRISGCRNGDRPNRR